MINSLELSEGWKIVKLEEITVMIDHGKTPRSYQYSDNGCYKIIKVRDLTENGYIRWDINEKGFVKESYVKEFLKYKVDENDILIVGSAHSKEHIGKKIAMVRDIPKEFKAIFFVGELIRVKINQSKADPYYVFQVLRLEPIRRSIQEKVKGSHIYVKDIKSIVIPIPPLDEQRRIASILFTVDETIAKTDAIIYRVEELRRALLDYLMTHGIRHEEYKKTEIGKIPKEWSILNLGSVCKFKRGVSYRRSDITNSRGNIRFITIKDLEKEGGWKRKYTTVVYLKNSVKVPSEAILQNGNILIAITDMSKGFIIGAPLLIKNLNEKATYSMDLVKLIFDKSKILPEYLFYYLLWRPIRRKMKSIARGTNVLHLDMKLVKKIPVVLPPISEQHEFVRILSTVDQLLTYELGYMEKLIKLKIQLTNLLLTGKVRVKDLPID